MTDKKNVITVTQTNLDWINENVPGRSKQARLETMLGVYKKVSESPLPPLDRNKLGDYLRGKREQIAFRDGKWIPREKLRADLQMEYDLIVSMIAELVSGQWNLDLDPAGA